MIFLNSNFILFMLIPLLVLAYFIVTNKKDLERVFDKEVLKKLIIKRNYLGIFGKNILLFSALILFIISLSRPVKPKEELELKSKIPSVAILLDISASMFTKDIYPNRLTFAKKKIIQLLSDTNAYISIYLFSDRLYQLAPKTKDLKTLIYLLQHLEIDNNISKSSNILDAIKNIKEKNIIIFSDGTQIKDFSQLKSLNKDIKLYLTATDDGAIILKDNKILRDSNNQIIITKANDSIKSVAKVIYFSYDNNDVKKLLENKNEISYTLKDYKELYIYPLLLAFVLLIFIFFSPKFILKNFKLFIMINFLYLFPTNTKALFFDFIDIKKANDAYHDKNYTLAIKYFKNVVNLKNSAEAYYNLANSYYKNKQYKKALFYYKKVITNKDTLRYKSFFNMGNCYFMLKEYDKAYEFYLLAFKIKKTNSVQKNILEVQKHIKNNKNKNFLATIKQNIKKHPQKELKIKSILIPITRGVKDAKEPW